MQRNFPTPLAEMVHFRLDTSKLQSNLDFILNLVTDSKTDLEATKSFFQSGLNNVNSEITDLRKLEPKLATCQTKILEFQNLKGKIDSWDDRFRSLEEKIFNIQHETNTNLKELSNTIEASVSSTKSEFETALNVIQKNLDEKYSKQFEEFDSTSFENFARLENIINNELARRCTVKMVKKLIKIEIIKSVSKTTGLVSNSTENEIDEKRNEEKEEDNEEDFENYNMSEIYLRLGNLEKKLNLDIDNKHKTDFPQRHGRFMESAGEVSKIENLSDFQLKFIRIVNEINDIRENISSMSSQINNHHNGLPTSTVDLNTFEEMENKISHMESLHKKSIEELNNQIYYLKNEISSSGSPVSKRRQKSSYTLSAKSVHSLTNLEQTLSSQVESISEKINSEIESIKKEISTIQNNLTLKVFRAELEEILTKLSKQSRASQKSETPSDGSPGHDIKSLEGRVNSMWMNLEKIHKMEEAFQKVINENIEIKLHKFDDKLDSQYRELLEKMQDMQRFFVVEVGDKGDQIDYFAEKMQNVEEAIKDMKEHQKPIVKYQVIDNKNEGDVQPDVNLLDISADGSIDMKNLIKQLKLQDSHLKQANNNLQKLSSDVEKIKEIINKDQEDGLNAYLNQLEDLQKNVSEVMTKVQEGSRLSQRDFSMLTELYQIIEGKGNKDEILEKVDRKELKQAYRNLSKKIDTVQDELKKIEDLKNKADVKVEKPAFFMRKGNECLACGQDIPTPAYTTREWTYSGSFPALTHSRFGPGFSRVLPMVLTSNDTSNKSHKKSKSELPLPLMRTVETADPDPKLISVTLSRKASVKNNRIATTTIHKERF